MITGNIPTNSKIQLELIHGSKRKSQENFRKYTEPIPILWHSAYLREIFIALNVCIRKEKHHMIYFLSAFFCID